MAAVADDRVGGFREAPFPGHRVDVLFGGNSASGTTHPDNRILMTAPSLPTFKALFARCKNRCAFPECTAPIAEDNETVTGEVCHIRAQKPGGPRYDHHQTPSERNAGANLVLLCARHHKIVDTETEKFTIEALQKMKRMHEEKGVPEISPAAARVAQQLLANYTKVSVVGNSGNVAINSPGAIQANTITFKNTKARSISIQPPAGSIGAAQAKASYCQHLIERYQEFQKADRTGKTQYKFMAIHMALKRKFGTTWKLLGEDRFEEVIAFLQSRIDATVIGKLNRSKGQPNYSAFGVWRS